MISAPESCLSNNKCRLCKFISNMMVGYSETEDEFFDTYDDDDVSSASDLSCDCSEACLRSRVDDSALGYQFWTKEPDSVGERRGRFLKWMGLSSDSDQINELEEKDSYPEGIKSHINDRLRDNGEAVLANLDSTLEISHCCSLQSFRSYDASHLLEDDVMKENLILELKNLDNGIVGSDKRISPDEFQEAVNLSSFARKLLRKDYKGLKLVDPLKKLNSDWLQRVSDRTKGFLCQPEISPKMGSSDPRIRVNVNKKTLKELSYLYTGQEFPAHEGSIVAMKFSHDGQYLASAGVDGVVRIWKVLQDDSINKFNSQDVDPSCLYFSLDHLSKLSPLDVPKVRDDRMKNLRKSSDSACVILPPKVFQLSEKPLHEYNGHKGEVLSLSWSKNGHLLSSSIDRTARLWKVGRDSCLGVYSHNNYVTCVEFNPVDDNLFISGSIDGKLRIWEVQTGRVIDWIDIREIVTAVCYSPDGKGGIAGSMDGNCHFYDIIDNCLQLGASICLNGKKKLPGKRITSLEYCPNEESKVMVTSADSGVQIISGTNIIYKLKGNRSSLNQVAAAFTSDGEHIVTAREDSDVCVFNYTSQNPKSKSSSQKKRSCESFFSRNASIAIPWCGLKSKLGALPGSILRRNTHFDEKLLQKFAASFPNCLTTSLGLFLDGLYGGAATSPEEKLTVASNPATVKPTPSRRKSEFSKFLKNAWANRFNPPHLWGLVIVTAGWDGCIRTFLNHGLPVRF